MSNSRYLSVALALALPLTACAQAGPPPETQTEFTVDASALAGDVKAVTGTVERVDIPAEGILPRAVDVWLPPTYSAEPNRRYPVLYMHDGQNVFDPETAYVGWDWGVDEALTTLNMDVIVVAMHNIPAVRLLDYFPEKAADSHADEIAKHFPGFERETLTGDDYLRFIVDAVKPTIDAEYRTKPGRDDTTIMGSSMGGLISLYAISEYPEVFGAAGAVSTHFPIADGLLVDYFAERLPDPDTHRLYFDFGTNTLDWNYEDYQDRMDTAVEAAGYERGVNWTTRKFDGHDHSERSWRSRVHVPLQFLLDGEDVDGGERR